MIKAKKIKSTSKDKENTKTTAKVANSTNEKRSNVNKEKKEVKQTVSLEKKENNNLLKKKKSPTETTGNTIEDAYSDSSDEEILLRTGNVPRVWYKEYDHAGYDINSNKVIKPDKEDEVEKFLKQANDKNWWRNIFDEDNNKQIFISKKDIELIKRIKSGKFANPDLQGEEYEYFEKNLEKELFPASNHRRGKKAFEVSKNEKKLVNRIIAAYKNGFIKLFDDELQEEKDKKKDEGLYDMWSGENTDPNIYNPGKGFPAPKRPLPDVEESYNPPDNVVESLTERKQEFDKNNIYNLPVTEDEKIFEAKKYDCLRKIPFYKDLLPENFYRMCDLFMSSRVIRKKKDLNEQDLIPQLPKPEELKPFPTMESVIYRGHESSVVSICMDPNGKFMISGDTSCFVMFWDIDTSKIIKRISVSDDILTINFNPILHLITIVCKESVYFLLPPYLDKKTKNDVSNLIDTKVIF